MQFLSSSFIILWTLAFALYYLLPPKLQWYVLLVSGILFYVAGSKGIPLALLATALTTYGCALYLQKSFARQKEALVTCADKEQKKRVKEEFAKKRKKMQILYFIVNLALLVFYKYAVLALPVLRGMPGVSSDFVEKLVMPLGISFYTLTAMGYVIDAGRENCEVETNFLKILLFLSYFPAVTQGPFNRFRPMKEQFGKAHEFDYERMLRSIQRFVWGAFKKLVIADRIGIFVDRVFESDGAAVPGSIFACAVVFYMLQLYADFSGYIDMAMGVSESFDIFLPENFKRPYFAKSVAEFWRRWHITLGTWFKDYVMFSFVMSGTGRKIGKACKKKWNDPGRHVVPIIGTMLVWFFTGAWHGRTVSYMLWGVYYGVIMSLSLVLEPYYPVWKKKLHIREGKGYAFFCMVRTWMIVFVADVLIRSESLAQAGAVFQAFLTRLNLRALLSKAITSYGLSKYEFLLLFAALLIWLTVSIWEEKGKDVRAYLAEKPVLLRWSCYYGIVLLLLITGIYGGNYDTAAFMYQSF
ncbi:MAG: MBOAT family protein [Lachnospiraceae bacterium]|nr:MBOAT family protein [Lachnospiraceae bacterium]